jgi:hypothetical protein
MDTRHVEALSALIDGEIADPTVLDEALRDPQAPQYLVNAARLRVELRDTTVPGSGLRNRVEAALSASSRRGARRHRLFTFAAAVALAVAALAAGMQLGGRVGPLWPQSRADSMTVKGAPTAESPPRLAAPPSDRVIQFTVNRDWREGS